ncbi:hypothetical protein Tco_0253162 [Tanacetum coccineum]
MQKGFLGSGGGGGNNQNRDGIKVGNDSTSRHAKLDDNLAFPKLSENVHGDNKDVVMEGVDEQVSTIPKSFPSLVTNQAVTCKVNFRSLDSDKPINAKVDVKIPKASILDVYSRFDFSLYGYFVGKRVAFLVVEKYVKNAWKKFGLVHEMMNSKSFFFFKFSSVEGMNRVHMDYARALIDIRADREINEDMLIAIPNVEYDGEVLHTVRVEYE